MKRVEKNTSGQEPTLRNISDALCRTFFERLPLGVYVFVIPDVDDPGSPELIAANPRAESEARGDFNRFMRVPLRKSVPELVGTVFTDACLSAAANQRVERIEDFHFPGTGSFPAGDYEAQVVPLSESVAAVVFRNVTEERAVEEAQDLLRHEVRRKDEFIALLGHELRNPLAAISTVGGLLRTVEHRIPDVARAREIIERQIANMSRILEDLMDLTRLTSGKLSVHCETIDVLNVIRQVVEDNRSRAETLGIDLRRELPKEAVWVEGDRVRLTQIFENLLANALKFTPAPGEVIVEAAECDGDIRISVRDTGIGFSEDQLEDLFVPFRQGPTKEGKTDGGLGLGLSLCKQLVDLHGGSIDADSPGPDLGATFTVTIPVTDAPRSSQSQERDSRAGSHRILLVEDEPDTSEALKTLLEMMGHEVFVTADGVEALHVAAELAPDVIISDIGLPGRVDGLELARRIRSRPELSDTRMIALSGFGAPEDEDRSLSAGFNLHLTKPITSDELNAVLVSPV